MKLRNLILTGCLCLVFDPLHAADIYRWVDDQGQTQLSDVVPERYRDRATRISSRKFELTSEQKLEARDRAVYEAQRARDENVLRRQANEKTLAFEQERRERAAQELARARAKTDSVAPADNTNSQCEALWRRYNNGVACFSRFAAGNVGGRSVRIRPEAFQFCADAPLPPSSCSPPVRAEVFPMNVLRWP